MDRMDCRQMQALLDAALDGELDLVTQMSFDAHLETCAACRAAYDARLALVSRVRAEASRFPMPAGLEARLLAALPDETPQRQPLFRRPWLTGGAWLASAAALAASLILTLSPHYQAEDADEETRSLVAAHVRSLMPQHLTDVPSSDKHTVKPWFNGRLSMSPPVPNLEDAGYPLVGGRLDYVDERTAAALVYRHKQHIINLFVWATPNQPDHPPRERERNGYHLLEWSQGGVTYSAVSDVNLPDLQAFQRLWVARAAEGEAPSP